MDYLCPIPNKDLKGLLERRRMRQVKVMEMLPLGGHNCFRNQRGRAQANQLFF